MIEMEELARLEAELSAQTNHLENNINARDYRAAKECAENIVALITELHRCSVNLREEPCVLTSQEQSSKP